MLLVIDVGNTNTVLGVFNGETLVDHWRIESRKGRTCDELGILIRSLLESGGIPRDGVKHAAISCVVPSLVRSLAETCSRYLGITPLLVGPGIKSGMAIHVDNPKELGADRLVNSVAAFEKYKTALIVVDFGTATTFDCVSRKGEYIGGAIAPGFQISSEALFRQTSKLPRIELGRPKKVIGKNTIDSMKSGLYFGYVGLVDGIVSRIIQSFPTPPKVIATGGLASLIADESVTIEGVEPDLTLEGLRILRERNQ